MIGKQLPTTPVGPHGIEVSSLGLGCMGLAGTWNPSEFTAEHQKRGILALEAAVEEGITFFDHADIYGRTLCESVFGHFLASNRSLRDHLFIATKAGILFADEEGPQRYNLSEDYLLASVTHALHRLQIEQIDLFQLHRPDPLTHPRETAKALNQLVREERVRYVGVSNYFPSQVTALQSYLDVPLITTQPSISLWNLETLHNGVLDQCTELDIRPLAYSPLGRGVLANFANLEQQDHDPRSTTLRKTLLELCDTYNATPAQLSLAWLMHHPARIIPLLGSNRPENIREGVKACHIQLSRDDWYKLWVGARCVPLP